MRISVVAALVLVGCAGPFEEVKNAKTLEAAKGMLGSYKPLVVTFPPSAEAWYFGKNQCVLFVDGEVRMSRSSTLSEDGVVVRKDKQKQVSCNPSELSATPPPAP